MKIMLQKLFVISILTCGVFAKGPATGTDRIILCSFYPVYISTINIAAAIPGITVIEMTKPQTGCLHDYQLTPDDLVKLSKASVLVVNGAGMESFIAKVIRQQPTLIIVDASAGIPLIRGAAADDDNPHVWVSVSNAIVQVRNISAGLALNDPKNAEAFRKNAAIYTDTLVKLKERMHTGLSGVSSRDIITFHEAFPYFAQEFDLRIAAVIEREPGSEPSAGDLARIIRTVRSQKVKALFVEPQYPAKSARIIATETGAKIFMLDPVVTGPKNAGAYVSIMNANLQTLKEALR